MLEEFGTPDVIIDDGGHVQEHINVSFVHLYPRLSKSGLYIVEDLHDAYWPAFGGGLNRAGTFIESAKRLIDELNADHMGDTLASTPFTHTTHAICFYESVVVFERGPIHKENVAANWL